MIKIIKHGTLTKTTCAECGCIFTYEDEDVLSTECCVNDRFGYTRRYIECPQCKTQIILEATR